jgi:hypothetical protein
MCDFPVGRHPRQLLGAVGVLARQRVKPTRFQA